MITSTTELLNEVVGDSGLPTTSGAKLYPRTSKTNISFYWIMTTNNYISGQLSAVSVKMRKEFAVRYDCMQAWFLRSSREEKIKSLTLMLEGLNNTDCLALILNTLMISSSKPTVYAETQ